MRPQGLCVAETFANLGQSAATTHSRHNARGAHATHLQNCSVRTPAGAGVPRDIPGLVPPNSRDRFNTPPRPRRHTLRHEGLLRTSRGHLHWPDEGRHPLLGQSHGGLGTSSSSSFATPSKASRAPDGRTRQCDECRNWPQHMHEPHTPSSTTTFSSSRTSRASSASRHGVGAQLRFMLVHADVEDVLPALAPLDALPLDRADLHDGRLHFPSRPLSPHLHLVHMTTEQPERWPPEPRRSDPEAQWTPRRCWPRVRHGSGSGGHRRPLHRS